MPPIEYVIDPELYNEAEASGLAPTDEPQLAAKDDATPGGTAGAILTFHVLPPGATSPVRVSVKIASRNLVAIGDAARDHLLG